MFESTISEGVFRLRRPEMRWLSTGWNGGFERAATADNIEVPEGWDRTDLETYVAERRERAGFVGDGPALLTGVSMRHARAARLGSVEAHATAGVSNPAALPMNPTGSGSKVESSDHRLGTVNVIVGTTRRLTDGALSTLLTVVAEAKTATLLATTGFPGTTTDAIVVGSDGSGELATFTGSATPVGSAARACVREAVRASLQSRYADREVPESVADAEYGVVTDRRAEVFEP